MRERIAYTPKETANLIGVSVRALEEWRRAGKGPAYVQEGRRLIRYPRRSLHQWLDARLVRTIDQKDATVL